MGEPRATTIPVLEIGGTHVTAALVDSASWRTYPDSESRTSIRAQGTEDKIVEDVARAAQTLPVIVSTEWAVAIPGPFDYSGGIGLFEHVGKFDSLRGVDVRAALSGIIEPTPSYMHFLNDADAYGVGEFAVGAGRGRSRLVCITLWTGVGSAFLVDGEPLNSGPSVPSDGSVHLLEFKGKPLEETISRRAIRASFTTAAGSDAGAPDVHEIAALARRGDAVASRVLGDAFTSLGAALAEPLATFEADALVIGGSMSRSWDLVEPSVRAGLGGTVAPLAGLPILAAEHPEDAPVVGAAFWAAHHRRD